jgi:hypothetical protein
MPPDLLQEAIREVKAVSPACFGVDIIARFSGIEHIEVCVAEKVPVVVFFWDDMPDEWLSRLRAAYAHPQYKERVVAAGVEDTARHLIFGPEFPDASTRGLRNRIVRKWERHDDPLPYRWFRIRSFR